MTDEQWKKKLTPEQYKVLREKGTEPPFSGEHLEKHGDGIYMCIACGVSLFDSKHQTKNHLGWPGFYEAADSGNTELSDDTRYGMHRIEVSCKNCGSHLGHVFDDGYDNPTGQTYCINSVSLDFKPKKSSKINKVE